MKKYICWENGFETFDETEIRQVYENEVDKLEYTTFDCWITDMLIMGILIESV